jgi:hypothetical protein
LKFILKLMTCLTLIRKRVKKFIKKMKNQNMYKIGFGVCFNSSSNLFI